MESVEVEPREISTPAEFGAALSKLTKGRVRGLADAAEVPRSTLSGWANGQHLPNPNQMDQFRRLLGALGVSGTSQDEWADAVLRVRRAPSTREHAQSPYPGLRAFEKDDADWFFGRQSAVAHILGMVSEVERDTHSPRLVIVMGASGAGKSSMLRAGLAAQLANSTHAKRRVILVTPARLSIGEMVAAGQASDEPPVIIVDQLEEIFGSDVAEGVRSEWLSRLLSTAALPSGPSVVVAVRADFYQRLLAVPGYDDALQRNQMIARGMSMDELREAIVEPARRSGIDVQEELVQLMLSDFTATKGPKIRVEAGSLPLLAHALHQTFNAARQRKMTVADYLRLGGLKGAVEQTAEAAFSALDAGGQRVARELFRRLVNLDAEGVVTRRPVGLMELAIAESTQPRLSEVMFHFVDARLLTVEASTVSLSHESLLAAWGRLHDWVQQDCDDLVAHRQLREAHQVWEANGRDTSTLLGGARLERVEDWSTTPAGQQLMASAEREFLQASRQVASGARRRDRRRRQRLVALAVVATLFAVAATIGAVAARQSGRMASQERDRALSRRLALQSSQTGRTDPALAGRLALVAYRTSDTVEARSALIARSAMSDDQRFLGGDGSTALGVADDGRSFAVTNAADGSVQLFKSDQAGFVTRWNRAMLPASDSPYEFYAAALSTSRGLLAAGGTNGTVVLWSIPEGDEAPAIINPSIGLFDGGVQAIRFDAAGNTLFIGGPGGAVLRFDITDPGEPEELAPLEASGVTKSIDLSPDQRFLAAGGEDGVLRVFDIQTSTPTLVGTYAPTIEGDVINAVAFDPAGAELAVGYRSHELRILSLDSSGAPAESAAPPTQFTSRINALDYSPDGKWLVVGSSDNTMRTWRVGEWTEVKSTALGAPITGIGFLNDGDSLVNVSFDGTARVWSTNASPFTGPRATVFNMTFDPSSSRLAAFPGQRDGTIEVWDARDPSSMRALNDRIPGLTENPYSGAGAITDSGRLILAGTSGGPAVWIDTTDPGASTPASKTLDGQAALVETVVISRDGSTAVIGGDDQTVQVWDIVDRAEPWLIGTMTADEAVFGVDIHPTLPLVAVASADDNVYLWDYTKAASSTNPMKLTGFTNDAAAVVFSDDGTLLAASGNEHVIRVWDVSDPTEPTPAGEPITGPQASVFGLDFQPGTRLLAGAAQDGTTWVWNLDSPARPSVFAALRVNDSPLNAVAFSPDGEYLVAAGAAMQLYVFDLDLERVAERVCSSTGDDVTPAERETLLQDVPDHKGC